ncbi:MAG: GNAT family N-acetyltransferase [Candidatus Hodarchaeota archaeon]
MINLRPATPDDLEFLYNLKKQTLKQYITQTWGWDENVQLDYHKKNFEPGKYHIIQEDGKDIGCISIEEQPNKIMLNIIEITPGHQNKGIGTKLIRDLIRKGSQAKKPVELQVLKVNQRAFQLYKSLGFKLVDKTVTHYRMIKQS